jgi:NTP pyrophosphatase (non-canonical NTP hydrolase)
MKQEQFEEITKWQKETFNPTTLSCLKHLQEEILEVTFDLKDSSEEKKREEFADCFILLFGAAATAGMDYNTIVESIRKKMEMNKSRNWTLDKSGKHKHVEFSTELERWLEKTKSLNLSFNELWNYIGHPSTCDYDKIFIKLEGEDSKEKAKILYNKWKS